MVIIFCFHMCDVMFYDLVSPSSMTWLAATILLNEYYVKDTAGTIYFILLHIVMWG